MMNKQNKNWLLGILIFSIAITSIHYTDNAIFVDDYPEPEWITTSGVFISWGVMTLMGITSYWLYGKQNFWLSYLLLGIYSITGLSSPTHYLYGGLPQFSAKMHTFIWLDAIAGSLIVAFIIWSTVPRLEKAGLAVDRIPRSGLIIKEWRTTKEIEI